ncbi:MAG: DMT family transporter [Pseudomonadota bacterium]
MHAQSHRPNLIALAALALTVVIWAAFLVVTRAAMTGDFGPIEVGLIRFGTGALLFLPLIVRQGALPKGVSPLHLCVLPLFGGIGFLVPLSLGLSFAPVADGGVFTPSMMPLYAALLAFAVLGERFARSQILGFSLIVAGAVAVGGGTVLAGEPGDWRGHLLFTVASISWAIYTVGFRRSGLAPAHGAALLCFWSAVAFGMLGLFFGVSFEGIGVRALALQFLLQGVLSGFVASYTYFYAVKIFGAARSAAAAALVPVLAALGGAVFLGEALGPAKALGIAVVVCGVALASGGLRRSQRRLQ